jgi:hypothetical protein
VSCDVVPNTVVNATEFEGFDDDGNRTVRVEAHGVGQCNAKDAVEAVIRIFAVLESSGEVFEVHVVVDEGGESIAAVDTE